MDKLKMHTPDLAEENFRKLAALFPNAVTETKKEDGEVVRAIDADALRQEISAAVVEGAQERYQFTWPDKRRSVVLANQPIAKTLRPCAEESSGRDGTPGRFDSENLYIEGDNLDALKLLRETYLGKIKMIYIDPPYNTGSDFIYRDDFSAKTGEYLSGSGQYDDEGNQLVQNTESNGRFHTDWLNMLYPRLRLAKDLLTDDGVIFISIDDNEQENLKKICNEVFGERNFAAAISWRRTDNQPNIGNFARVKEYILVYSKSKAVKLGKLPLTEKAKAEYRYQDAKGRFRRAILLDKTRGRKYYRKITKSGHVLEGPWMVAEEEFDRMDAAGEIYWTNGRDEQPYGKIYLHESQGQIPNDFWGIEFGTNQRGSLEVEALFGRRYFDFPKPVSLLCSLLSIGDLDSDSIVLDFFSGSATTAHAVMQLNAEDGGSRKFIMVQLPEPCAEGTEAAKAGYKNICEIGKERIRRAAKKIREETQAEIDCGFRVFQVDSSNLKDVYYRPADCVQEQMELFADNLKADRTPEDLLFQVMLDLGMPLSARIEESAIAGKKVFSVSDGYLIACFDSDVTGEVVKEIAERRPCYAVFRDSGMASDSVLANFEQIFDAVSPGTHRKVL